MGGGLVSGAVDPGADPRLRFDEPMRCECGGAGTVVDAADAGGGWWLVTWLTEHRPGCVGLTAPERAYLVDAEGMSGGDYALPGLAAERVRRRQPPAPARCEWCGASLAGRRADAVYCGRAHQQAAYRARRGTSRRQP